MSWGLASLVFTEIRLSAVVVLTFAWFFLVRRGPGRDCQGLARTPSARALTILVIVGATIDPQDGEAGLVPVMRGSGRWAGSRESRLRIRPLDLGR